MLTRLVNMRAETVRTSLHTRTQQLSASLITQAVSSPKASSVKDLMIMMNNRSNPIIWHISVITSFKLLISSHLFWPILPLPFILLDPWITKSTNFRLGTLPTNKVLRTPTQIQEIRADIEQLSCGDNHLIFTNGLVDQTVGKAGAGYAPTLPTWTFEH